MDKRQEATAMEATSAPEPVAQPTGDQETEDYEVPVDPHDGVDCEDCQ
jgi:hypothetical protein